MFHKFRNYNLKKEDKMKRNHKKVIHIKNAIKTPMLSYTRSYPQYPPTKNRNKPAFFTSALNKCFVNSDRKQEK